MVCVLVVLARLVIESESENQMVMLVMIKVCTSIKCTYTHFLPVAYFVCATSDSRKCITIKLTADEQRQQQQSDNNFNERLY